MSQEQELVRKIRRLMVRKYGTTTEDAMRRMFTEYAERDDRVSGEELGKLLKDADVGNVITRSLWVSGVMARVDADDDGSITWDEYRRVLGE